MRSEPAPKQDRGASAAAGRKLRIEIRGPRNNVDLAFPMQAVAALTSLTAAVPQVRTAIDAHGLDLEDLQGGAVVEDVQRGAGAQ